MATALVIGTVIGSGVFKKPAIISRELPFSGAAAIVWILGGLLVLLGALAYAEISVLYPRAGGNYVFLREGYGRLFGWLWGWVDFGIIRTASIAALAIIFTESLNDILSNPMVRSALGRPPGRALGFWEQKITTVVVIMGLALVNVRGVKWGGGLQVLITTVKVGSLLAILLLPFLLWFMLSPSSLSHPPRVTNLEPVWPNGWSSVSIPGLSAAFLGVLWAYHGWQNIGPAAEEVARPQRNIPLALLLGVVVIILLYLGANVAYYLVIPQPEMAALKDTTVVAEFGLRLLGPIGGVLAAAAVMISVFGALNGNLLVGPRLLYAMGADGLAPRKLSRVHPRYHTPDLAILTVAIWSSLLVMGAAVLTEVGVLPADKDHFDQLTDLAMFGAIIFETMAVMTIFVFRWKQPDAERPYRCWGYPVVPALYVLLPAFILYSTFVGSPGMAVSATIYFALGVVVYYALGLWKSPSEGVPLPEERPPDKSSSPPVVVEALKTGSTVEQAIRHADDGVRS
jgi:amino acid transporter